MNETLREVLINTHFMCVGERKSLSFIIRWLCIYDLC